MSFRDYSEMHREMTLAALDFHLDALGDLISKRKRWEEDAAAYLKEGITEDEAEVARHLGDFAADPEEDSL